MRADAAAIKRECKFNLHGSVEEHETAYAVKLAIRAAVIWISVAGSVANMWRGVPAAAQTTEKS